MTWVIAKPFVQGYAMVIADTCVTYKDLKSGKTKYKDCLLKIHVISESNGLMVGFSGVVENAFAIIDDMRILASDLSIKSEDRKFDVIDFILAWKKYTSETKRHLYEDDEENGVHLLVIGNHSDNNSTGNKYAPCGAFFTKSPDYRPMAVHQFSWHAIGSGSDLQICKDIANSLSNDFRFRILALDKEPSEHVKDFLPKISTALELELQKKGVSNNLVMGISTVGKTDYAYTYKKDGSRPKSIDDLVGTFEELEKLLRSKASAKFRA